MQRPLGTESNRFESALRSPMPPTKPKPAAGMHGLNPRHLKGVAVRDSLRKALHGERKESRVGCGRWSHRKGVLTELLRVAQGTSVVQLIATLSQAQASGAQNWPEFLRAAERLRVLEGLRHEMEAALECVEIEVLESLMRRACDIGIIAVKRTESHSTEVYLEAHPEFKNLMSSLEKRLSKLRRLREDLRSARQSADIQWVSNTLKLADELGVQQEVDGARVGDSKKMCPPPQVRLEELQSYLGKMTRPQAFLDVYAASCLRHQVESIPCWG